MAKVRSMKIKFAPSASPDVVSYKLYTEADPGPVDYNSTSYDLGMPPLNADNKCEVDLATVLPGSIDGVYNLGVVAVDDAGNESGMSKADAVPLDFSAPAAPGVVEVEVV